MNFLQMIKKGFLTSWEYKNAVFFLWIVNLVFAVFVIHPYIGALSNYFSKSAIVDLFMDHHFNLIANEFSEIIPAAKGMLWGAVLLGAVIYYLLAVALNGGFIGLLVRERGYKIASLLRSGFGNYKYLFLISLVSVAGTILLFLSGAVIYFVLIKIFSFESEPGFVYTFLGVLPVVLVFYLFKEIWVDFMRIKYFRNLTEQQGIHFKQAFSKMKSHLGVLFLFGISMFIILLIIYVVGHYVGAVLSGMNIFIIILSFIWMQIALLGRLYWRVSFWAGEVALLEGPMGGKITEKDLWPEEEL